MKPPGLRILAAAWVLLAALAGGAAADPRLEEARALLGEPERYPRAVELFGEVLAERPDDTEVRLWRARVLSWSERYDESLADYARVIAAPDAPPEARHERAEVLSWSGRLDEAREAFDALLADAPDDARAARGLARTLAWSGRVGAADRAYARALELEPDAEAREEWTALRANYQPSVRVRFDFTEDNDDFQKLASGFTGFYFLDPDTRVQVRTAMIRVDHPRDEDPVEALGLPPGVLDSTQLAVASALLGEPRVDDRAYELAVGVERRFAERVKGELELGWRRWEHADDALQARGRLEYTTRSHAAFSLNLEHGDLLERTESLAPVEEGLQGTTARVTMWKGFTPQIEAYAEFDGSLYSDANARWGAAANASYRPWLERAFQVHLAVDYLGFAKSSDLYYDPKTDVSVALSVSHRLELPARLALELDAGAGYGFARQDGLSGSGPAYHARGRLSWTRGRWHASLAGSRVQSQRRTAYVAHRADAWVGLDF